MHLLANNVQKQYGAMIRPTSDLNILFGASNDNEPIYANIHIMTPNDTTGWTGGRISVLTSNSGGNTLLRNIFGDRWRVSTQRFHLFG